ncbi:MAG: hypothetical protein L6R41_003191 [Letrouitia leprolyta]|nr:MAG: hypothetical protein L6R41_003191 [Letrouitia leprolyta]
MRTRSKGKQWTIDNVSCIRITTLPPHPDRLTDLIYIRFYAKTLIDQLRRYPKLPRLVIEFKESAGTNETSSIQTPSGYPSRSTTEDHSLPRRTLEFVEHEYYDEDDDRDNEEGWERESPPKPSWNPNYDPSNREASCDLIYILDAFSLVTNSSAATIKLPSFLAGNKTL